MKLNKEEYMDIVDGYNPNFKLIKDDIVDTSRWAVQHDVVCQHIESGRFYLFGYDVPATEMQECDNPETIELIEVQPVAETIIVYKRI
jgi:hypothetical protein